MVELETADTREIRGEVWFENDMSTIRFAALLVCDNPNCLDPVAISGTLCHDYFQVGPADYETVTKYQVETVNPPPAPFLMGDKIPELVKDKVLAAAGLFWQDLDAAANMVRQAVEAILDDRKVKKYPRSGERRAIALHSRIVDYGKIYPSAADLLLAIKWIGNAGSHKGGLDREAVLDGFELFESALEETFVKHRHALMVKARKINARKRPLAQAKPKIGRLKH